MNQYKGFYVRENTLDRYVVNELNNYSEFLSKINGNDIALDLGGNIGTTAKMMALRAKATEVLEPECGNFIMLKKNLEGVERIKCINAAITQPGERKTLLFLNAGKNQGSHSLVVKKGRASVTVEGKPVNELSEDFTVLKMDIEGYEYTILPIILQKLKKLRLLAVEFHLNRKTWRGVCAQELTKLISLEGFKPIKALKIGKNWHTLGVWER